MKLGRQKEERNLVKKKKRVRFKGLEEQSIERETISYYFGGVGYRTTFPSTKVAWFVVGYLLEKVFEDTPGKRYDSIEEDEVKWNIFQDFIQTNITRLNFENDSSDEELAFLKERDEAPRTTAFYELIYMTRLLGLARFRDSKIHFVSRRSLNLSMDIWKLELKWEKQFNTRLRLTATAFGKFVPLANQEFMKLAFQCCAKIKERLHTLEEFGSLDFFGFFCNELVALSAQGVGDTSKDDEVLLYIYDKIEDIMNKFFKDPIEQLQKIGNSIHNNEDEAWLALVPFRNDGREMLENLMEKDMTLKPTRQNRTLIKLKSKGGPIFPSFWLNPQQCFENYKMRLVAQYYQCIATILKIAMINNCVPLIQASMKYCQSIPVVLKEAALKHKERQPSLEFKPEYMSSGMKMKSPHTEVSVDYTFGNLHPFEITDLYVSRRRESNDKDGCPRSCKSHRGDLFLTLIGLGHANIVSKFLALPHFNPNFKVCKVITETKNLYWVRKFKSKPKQSETHDPVLDHLEDNKRVVLMKHISKTTPLQYAIQCENDDMIKMLLEYGATVEYNNLAALRSLAMYPKLHLAAYKKRFDELFSLCKAPPVEKQLALLYETASKGIWDSFGYFLRKFSQNGISWLDATTEMLLMVCKEQRFPRHSAAQPRYLKGIYILLTEYNVALSETQLKLLGKIIQIQISTPSFSFLDQSHIIQLLIRHFSTKNRPTLKRSPAPLNLTRKRQDLAKSRGLGLFKCFTRQKKRKHKSMQKVQFDLTEIKPMPRQAMSLPANQLFNVKRLFPLAARHGMIRFFQLVKVKDLAFDALCESFDNAIHMGQGEFLYHLIENTNSLSESSKVKLEGRLGYVVPEYLRVSEHLKTSNLTCVLLVVENFEIPLSGLFKIIERCLRLSPYTQFKGKKVRDVSDEKPVSVLDLTVGRLFKSTITAIQQHDSMSAEYLREWDGFFDSYLYKYHRFFFPEAATVFVQCFLDLFTDEQRDTNSDVKVITEKAERMKKSLKDSSPFYLEFAEDGEFAMRRILRDPDCLKIYEPDVDFKNMCLSDEFEMSEIL